MHLHRKWKIRTFSENKIKKRTYIVKERYIASMKTKDTYLQQKQKKCTNIKKERCIASAKTKDIYLFWKKEMYLYRKREIKIKILLFFILAMVSNLNVTKNNTTLKANIPYKGGMMWQPWVHLPA